MIINMNGAKAPETPSPVMQEKTVTPETLPTVIGADEGYDGLSQVTVNPDADLKAENIKDGVSIFGVEGSYGKQFMRGTINTNGSQTTTETSFGFALDFSEYPKSITFNYPADIPQGMLLDPTTVRCDRPDFLIPARVPEHLLWLGVEGKAPWHMFNTQRGHKPDSFPYVITPAKEYRMMEDPINGVKIGNTFTLTYDQEVVNAPDNLTPENIKAGVTIAGIEGTYEPQPSEVTLETVVTTPESFPTVVTPSAGYDGLSRVTVHSPDNLAPENIKAGVSIAGVTGTYEVVPTEPTLQSKTVTPASLPMSITADAGYDGLSQVTVNPDAQLIPENIRSGKTVFGVIGSYTGSGSGGSDGNFKALVNKSITAVTADMLEGVNEIGEYAFYHCLSLTSVVIPSATRLVSSAFASCSSLTDVTLPNTLETIEGSVFQRCSKLASIVIPDSVTYIGYGAFQYCSALTSVNITPSMTKITPYCFSNCTSLENITIPSNITIIDNNSFESCTSLKKIVIPDSVTSFSGYATFVGCTSLAEVKLSTNIKSLPTSTFSGCTALTSIEIPSMISVIDNYVFNNCTSLTRVIMNPTSPPKIQAKTFNNCPLETITVPVGSLEAYQTATNWSAYADIMQEAA